MLEFLGENYYLDVSELERQVSYENSVLPVTTTGETETIEQQISVTRYDTFKSLIEVVLTERPGASSRAAPPRPARRRTVRHCPGAGGRNEGPAPAPRRRARARW